MRFSTFLLFCFSYALGTKATYEFIPKYITSLNSNLITWESPCFKTNMANAIIRDNTSVVIQIQNTQPKHWVCDDTYFLSTTEEWKIHTSTLLSEKVNISIPIKNTVTDVRKNGVRVFLFPAKIYNFIDEVYKTIRLYFGALTGSAGVSDAVATSNIQFFKNKMDRTLEALTPSQIANNQNYLNSHWSNFRSGDFIGILRLDGLDPLISWGTMSYLGHTATILEIDGVMYVVESQEKSNYWPKDFIQKTELKEWFSLAEKADYNVIHIPLKDELSNKLHVNLDKVQYWFRSVEGIRYGFQNFLFGWIDGPDNFPANSNLSSELLMVLMGILDPMFTNTSNTPSLWNTGLNYRIGNGHNLHLTTPEIFEEAAKKNISFIELLSIPEDDRWTYYDYKTNTTGKSMVCDVFVCNLYRNAGLFDDLDFNCAELTPFDMTELDFYKDGSPKQLLGKYNLSLEYWNRVKPFNHMREKCPSQAPNYTERKKISLANSC